MSGEPSFRSELTEHIGSVRGLKRTRAWRKLQESFPDITEAEVRRFLAWIERAQVSVEDDYAARIRTLAGAKQRQIEADAFRWRQWDKEVLSRLERHFAGMPCAPAVRLSLLKTKSPFIVVTSATDFHWGMYAWEGETGQRYDREVARARIRKHTQRILDRLPARPEQIIIAIGSDFFHIDGDEPKTTGGTVMQGVDGTPLEILISGIEVQQEQILMLREIAPVKVVQMVGNHDRVNGYTTLLVLHAWAKSVPGVEVVLDYKPRVYQTYGNTLLCFSHGDGAKPDRLTQIVASEARHDWGAAKYHIAFGGHKHHQRVEEHAGLTYYQLRSLAETDRWHAREGWVGPQRGLDAYIVDKEDGVIGAVYSVE